MPSGHHQGPRVQQKRREPACSHRSAEDSISSAGFSQNILRFSNNHNRFRKTHPSSNRVPTGEDATHVSSISGRKVAAKNSTLLKWLFIALLAAVSPKNSNSQNISLPTCQGDYPDSFLVICRDKVNREFNGGSAWKRCLPKQCPPFQPPPFATVRIALQLCPAVVVPAHIIVACSKIRSDMKVCRWGGSLPAAMQVLASLRFRNSKSCAFGTTH